MAWTGSQSDLCEVGSGVGVGETVGTCLRFPAAILAGEEHTGLQKDGPVFLFGKCISNPEQNHFIVSASFLPLMRLQGHSWHLGSVPHSGESKSTVGVTLSSLTTGDAQALHPGLKVLSPKLSILFPSSPSLTGPLYLWPIYTILITEPSFFFFFLQHLSDHLLLLGLRLKEKR